MPHVVGLLLVAAIFVAKSFDMISGQNVGDAIQDLFFNHFADACDQALGLLAEIFWIVMLVKLGFFQIWKWAQDFNCECSCLSSVFFYLILPPAVAFELIWPIWTFVCLCISSATGKCSQELKLGCWLLLAPYFLQVTGIFVYIIWQCVKPVLYRTGIIPDPGNLTREFQHINFRPEDFVEDEGGYPPSCSICLVDFSADDTDIVVTPCSGQRHLFHRACLATWFRIAQTCPLCRTALGGGVEAVVQGQAPLTQSALELASNGASQP